MLKGVDDLHEHIAADGAELQCVVVSAPHQTRPGGVENAAGPAIAAMVKADDAGKGDSIYVQIKDSVEDRDLNGVRRNVWIAGDRCQRDMMVVEMIFDILGHHLSKRIDRRDNGVRRSNG